MTARLLWLKKWNFSGNISEVYMRLYIRMGYMLVAIGRQTAAFALGRRQDLTTPLCIVRMLEHPIHPNYNYWFIHTRCFFMGWQYWPLSAMRS